MSCARRLLIAVVGLLLLFQVALLAAQETPSLPTPPSVTNLFREEFFLEPSERRKFSAASTENFILIPQSAPEWNSSVAIVTDFAPSRPAGRGRGIRSQALKGIRSIEEAKEWIRREKKTHSFEGIQIYELSLPIGTSKAQKRYWVGNKSFTSLSEAVSAVALIQKMIESQGGDFLQAVEMAKELAQPEPALQAAPEVLKTQAQFQKEEEIMLRWIDQLEIGDQLWGPFQGVTSGERILYQSFGETTWRSTNMAQRKFQSQVGFWSHRLVFKGIRFPLNTLDPFVELTGALESTGNDGGSQLDTSIGVEWRPLQRNSWLENFRPWGIPLLVWAKNYRFFMQYFNRRNLKDEIAFIRDEDFRMGFNIFYEWGVDLPSLAQRTKSKDLFDLLTNYVWGEYFGEYSWRHSNFTTEENYDAWLLDTSLILGIKTPAVKLPPNPLNEELVFMPYLRFAMTANTEFSNPFDNKYFVAVGIRWMPFRDYRFQENEWLFKTKVFAEWLAIGKIQHLKQDQDNRPLPDEDWRIGVSFSLRRF